MATKQAKTNVKMCKYGNVQISMQECGNVLNIVWQMDCHSRLVHVWGWPTLFFGESVERQGWYTTLYPCSMSNNWTFLLQIRLCKQLNICNLSNPETQNWN